MEILSKVGVGGLRFGEPRQQIRTRLGSRFKSFQKDVGEVETDAYDELGFHLYYDLDDRLEFVEMFAPANPAFNGVQLMGRDVVAVVNDLESLGHPVEFDDVGFNCMSAGFGVTANDGIVQGVAVFCPGYYE